MRILPAMLGIVIVGSFLVAMAPTSSAVGYCITKVKEPVPTDKCDGVVCIGYNSQTGWQTCVPPEIYCLHNPCCMYDAGTDSFYCPDPRQ